LDGGGFGKLRVEWAFLRVLGEIWRV